MQSTHLAFQTTRGLYPKSSPVIYSYFSNSPDYNVEVLSAFLSRLHWASFTLVLPERIFVLSVNVIFILNLKDFF